MGESLVILRCFNSRFRDFIEEIMSLTLTRHLSLGFMQGEGNAQCPYVLSFVQVFP